MYVGVHACVTTYAHHDRMFVRTYVRLFVCLYVYVCMYVCMFVCQYVRVLGCMYE